MFFIIYPYRNIVPFGFFAAGRLRRQDSAHEEKTLCAARMGLSRERIIEELISRWTVAARTA
jgi:hypothetical protein